ncbi:MAG: squalene/phytoene synthase family protein [Rhodospirillales bacterium]|nr:squalene/phytoene synthase family protein [Rhodospirillales bacterium]
MSRSDPAIESAKAWCADFVAARPSNVTRLAALLPRARRQLFFPAYCAMRVIDDEVDDGFLGQDAAARDAARPAMREHVEIWRSHATAATGGRYIAGSATGDDDIVFTAMNATLGQGAMGPESFHGLADAMQRDVSEQPLATWQDFLDYTEGAAVAPAAVFVYILACRMERDGSSTLALTRPAADYARHLAIFSYLVHILRDLRLDADRAPQHLTLPDDLLDQSGLSRATLRIAARAGDDAALAPLVGTIAALTERHHALAMNDLASLNDETDGAAAMLVGLAAVYSRQFDAIRSDHAGVLSGEAVVDMATVDRLLAGGRA